MEILFWLFLSTTVYCYLGYPVLLYGAATLRPKKTDKQFFEPTVAVILCAWNEEDVIGNKINNLCALDYPEDKITFLIGSDGSDDKTDTIVLSFTDKRVRLIRQEERKGKMALLTRLLNETQAEIIMFTDARQELNPDAVRELVANFHDQKIGCVSGELIFRPKSSATAKGINFYWNYEKFLRKKESSIHSMLGATGAIYAARKKLIPSFPHHIVLDDMYIPFSIIRQGYRVTFDESAKAFDDAAESPKEEYRRKTRTIYGNYQIFKEFIGLFNIFKSPVAIQFFSHKLLRVVVPFLLIFLFVINFLLLGENYFYKDFLLLQIIFYAMAVVGFLTRYTSGGAFKIILKLCYIPYVFCLLNFSALIGFLKLVASKQSITWEKARH